MEIVRRKLDWGRKTVKWECSELRNISTVLSGTKDQALVQPSTIPHAQELIHTELRAVLRWEDDGGQST